MITKGDLRDALATRLEMYATKDKEQDWPDKKHGVRPV